MRHVGDKIGAPAATVSQIERGQRALKEPKIAAWADALEVSEDDLHELWVLSQGRIPVGDRFAFYGDSPDVLGIEPLEDDIVAALRNRPDLEPIYRLAERIAVVLRRVRPGAGFRIRPDDDFEPPFVVGPGEEPLTAVQEDMNKQWANTYPLPCIERSRGGPPDQERRFEFEEGERVRVPLLPEFTPIVRRRGKSVRAADLEDMLRELSGPERERVRGYIDAIVEQRTEPED